MTKRVMAALSALIICLFLPDLFAGVSDHLLSTAVWHTDAGDSTYQHPGALENRVRAFEAWQNDSPAVQLVCSLETEADKDLAKAIDDAGLLPVHFNAAPVTARALTLSPRAFTAEYNYIEYRFESPNGKLTVTADAVTGKPLRIELTQADMGDWLKGHSINELLLRYAQLMGYEKLSELGGVYADNGLITGESMYVSATSFIASLWVLEEAGILIYKLSAAGT